MLLVEYGSPAEFVHSGKSITKASTCIKVNILNARTGDKWQKTLPRTITVHTLLGLILKHYDLNHLSQVQLSYIDANCPQLIVPMDKMSKTLDFYSIQENDVVKLCY